MSKKLDGRFVDTSTTPAADKIPQADANGNTLVLTPRELHSISRGVGTIQSFVLCGGGLK